MTGLITQNLGTILITLLLVLMVAGIIHTLIKDKKQGKSSCGCGSGCSGCPSQGMCHPDGNEKTDSKQ
jgi:hypothetical protein